MSRVGIELELKCDFFASLQPQCLSIARESNHTSTKTSYYVLSSGLCFFDSGSSADGAENQHNKYAIKMKTIHVLPGVEEDVEDEDTVADEDEELVSSLLSHRKIASYTLSTIEVRTASGLVQKNNRK